MIDLNEFTKIKTVIVPVVNATFKYHGKKYILDNNLYVEGWCEVDLQGNNCIAKNITMLSGTSIKKIYNTIKGYTYNNNIVFQNFDVGKRKTLKEVMTNLYFNSSPSFSSIEAVIWEDGELYYSQPNYNDFFICEVKQLVENNKDYKKLKGMTPELKTLCLFHEIEKIKLKEELKKEKENELKNTLQGKLILAFRRTGAELIKYSITGNRIIVDWKIGEDDKQIFNSVIDKTTFTIIEAGYCMSGQDTLHSLHSMVVLAKDYDNDDLIYKTRE